MSIIEPSTSPAVDRRELEARVTAMYREVAETPDAGFHFEMGRALAEEAGFANVAFHRPWPAARQWRGTTQAQEEAIP